MEELIKSLIYTGVGLVSMTADKLQKTIDSLVAERKISVEEGRKIVEDFMKSSDNKKEVFESQLSQIVNKVVHNLNLATSKEIEDLHKRISALEKVAAEKTADKKVEA